MHDQESVFDTLDKSNARLLHKQTINKHLTTAHWSNTLDRVTYHTDNVHTLSFYVEGGEGSRRIDIDSGAGHKGSLCILPREHQSQWEITAPFRFAHLYFSDESIKQFAANTLDIEPRQIEVPELTFHNDDQLVALTEQLFCNTLARTETFDIIGQEQTIQHVFAHLISDKQYGLKKHVRLTGGLSAKALMRVKDYIDQYSHQPLQLGEMATLVNLSEFHFLRMFKVSTGFTPNDYLQYVRIEKAKQAINNDQPLAEIALSCGFSHQSHFSRVFKQRVGITPGAFKAACR